MMERLSYIAIQDVPFVRVLGRTSQKRNPLTLFWTGSGVEFGIAAGELWVEFTSDYNQLEPWISIQVNGAFVSRQMITKGIHRICVFCGMNPERVKQVRIVKDTQAMSGDETCLLQLHGFYTNGKLLAPPEHSMKIEWIGDSITSGEGAIGAVEEEDWIPMFFSALRNYAVLTSNALDADYRILSQSGWGVVSGYDNNPHCALPDYYRQICGVVNGERNRELGAWEPNDFTAWQPDVIVINLGTNDNGAFHQPEWRDEQTGEHFQQRSAPDGTPEPEDLRRFEEKAAGFLSLLRECNPKAELIWAFGMIKTELLHPICDAIENYRKKSGDFKVHLFILPEMTEQTKGARSHPGLECHRQAAVVLEEYIRSLMERQKEETEQNIR